MSLTLKEILKKKNLVKLWLEKRAQDKLGGKLSSKSDHRSVLLSMSLSGQSSVLTKHYSRRGGGDTKYSFWEKRKKAKLLSRVWLFATPWTVAYQAPLSMEFSRQEYWSGLPFPYPGDLPDPGIEPGSSTLQADALQSEPPGKSLILLNLWAFREEKTKTHRHKENEFTAWECKKKKHAG